MCNEKNKRDRASKQRRFAAEAGLARKKHSHRVALWPPVYKYDGRLCGSNEADDLPFPEVCANAGHCDTLQAHSRPCLFHRPASRAQLRVRAWPVPRRAGRRGVVTQMDILAIKFYASDFMRQPGLVL
jgi:hypothetical protein